MGQSRRMILFILILLCSGYCVENATRESSKSWSEAQRYCRENMTMLTNELHGFNATPTVEYYWTGYYIRMSKWIKMIGCFRDIDVESSRWRDNAIVMQFPSAAFCQEACIKFNSSVFGLQLNKCVCLENVPPQTSIGSDNCQLSCGNNYSAEISMKFVNECGGQNTYNVFMSDSYLDNIFVDNEHQCLSIQCSDRRFIPTKCGTDILHVCNRSVNSEDFARNWTQSWNLCKSKSKAYLFGDIPDTLDAAACKLIDGNVDGPRWLGIAKERYISLDKVIDNMVHNERNPRRCLKCNSDNCTFADCKESNYFVCLETQGTTSTGTVTSTTPHGTVSASTSPTGTNTNTSPHGTVSSDHSSITIFKATENATGLTSNKKESMKKNQDGNTTLSMIVVPVTVVVILGSIALLLVIVWRRQQTQKTAEPRHAHHEPDLSKHSEKSDTNHSLQNNYFVLEKTETYSVVNSTNQSKDKSCRSPYNECYDADYDHLGENVREKVEEEDNYHHAFFPSNEDESEYGIRNKSDECLIENPYSHTNTRDYHVALADNEYNTISIDA